MYRCELCNVILKRETKHNQTKKHRYYSDLILNRYVIKNVGVNNFENVFDPYFIAHTEKLISFTIHITLRD